MSKWNDHQAVRPGSVHTTTFGDQADQGFHGSVMDELNAELEAEIVAVKGGKPMSYRDDTSRPLQDLYSGSPTRSSPKRTRAIGERSPGVLQSIVEAVEGSRRDARTSPVPSCTPPPPTGQGGVQANFQMSFFFPILTVGQGRNAS